MTRRLCLLFAILTLSVFAGARDQTEPTQAACVSGPVTQGNETVTCTLLSMTPGGAGADNPGLLGAEWLQVKVTDSNASVSGVLITVSWQFTFPGAAQPTATTRTASAPLNTAGDFRYTFQLNTGLDSNQKPLPYTITQVQVQELSPISNQTF